MTSEFTEKNKYLFENPITEDLMQFLVLNKLCFDNEIYLVKESSLEYIPHQIKPFFVEETNEKKLQKKKTEKSLKTNQQNSNASIKNDEELNCLKQQNSNEINLNSQTCNIQIPEIDKNKSEQNQQLGHTSIKSDEELKSQKQSNCSVINFNKQIGKNQIIHFDDSKQEQNQQNGNTSIKNEQDNKPQIQPFIQTNEQILQANQIKKQLTEDECFIIFHSIFLSYELKDGILQLMYQCLKFILFVIIGPFIFIWTIYLLIKNKFYSSAIYTLFYLFVFCLVSQSLCIYLIYMISYKNKEAYRFLYGVCQLQICMLIQTYLTFNMDFFIMNSKKQRLKQETNDSLDELIVSTDQLYIESMNRNNYLIPKQLGEDAVYFFLKENNLQIEKSLKNMSQENKLQDTSKNVCPKIWNHGFIFLLQRQLNITAIFFTYASILYHVLQFLITYFILHGFFEKNNDDLQNSEEFLIYFFQQILIFYGIYCIRQIMQSLFNYYDFEQLSKIKSLTQLLQSSNNKSILSFEKNVETINIYCVQSIKSWFYTRELYLNINQKYLKYGNFVQFLEVIVFLSFLIILTMDYLEIGWKKKQIINNEYLFWMFIFNIVGRILFLITPIFFIFSEINDILAYNKKQIEVILNRLYNISPNYMILRANLQEQIEALLQEVGLETEGLEKNPEEKKKFIENMLSREQSLFKGKRKKQQIEDLRAIYEIKRNTEIYSLQNAFPNGENGQEKRERDQNRINREMQYLSQLIKTYKNLLKNLNSNKDKYVLKFLGILPITYTNFQTLLILVIPAAISVAYQTISKYI